MKNISYIPAIIVLFIIFYLHIILGPYLYPVSPWYDDVVHFLGGVWVGLTSVWMIYRLGKGLYGLSYGQNYQKTIIVAGTIAFIVGICWEIFEYLNGLTMTAPGETYKFDTVMDVMEDTLGAIISVSLILKKNK